MKPKKPRKKKLISMFSGRLTVLANKQPLTIHSNGFACMVPGSGIRVEVPEFIEINGKTTLQCISLIPSAIPASPMDSSQAN